MADKLVVHLHNAQRRQKLQEIEDQLVEHPFPPQLVIENTSYCNLQCIHCSHRESRRKPLHMARPLWNTLVEQVGQEAPDCELWPTFYGEALLLRDELWDRLHFAHQVGCRNLVLNSNGTLLRRWDNIDKILASPLKRFILSLDGLSPEVFETVRKKARWQEVYPAVEALCRRRQELGITYPVIIVQFSILEENHHEAAAFTDYWQARGAEVKTRPKLEWTATGSIRSPTIVHDQPFRIACPWANNTMAILADGTIAACAVDYDGQFSVGNSRQLTLRQGWQLLGEQLRQLHRQHRWPELPPLCRGCGDWQVAGANYAPETVPGTRPFWMAGNNNTG